MQTPTQIIALDAKCQLFGPLAHNPLGIDRVELAYATQFLSNWQGKCIVVLPTARSMRYFDRAWALRGLSAIEEIWRERILPEDDPAYQRTTTAGIEALVCLNLKPTNDPTKLNFQTGHSIRVGQAQLRCFNS